MLIKGIPSELSIIDIADESDAASELAFSVYSISHFFLPGFHVRYQDSLRETGTYLYSNKTWLSMNRTTHARKRNRSPETIVLSFPLQLILFASLPSEVPNSCCKKNWIPSTPTTNPTRFAIIIIMMLKTPPIAHTWRYQGRLPN